MKWWLNTMKKILQIMKKILKKIVDTVVYVLIASILIVPITEGCRPKKKIKCYLIQEGEIRCFYEKGDENEY